MKLLIISFSLLFYSVSTTAKEFNLYLDADMTIHKDSGLSIQKGIGIALDEFNKKNPEITINLITLDHRGNTRRSLANFKKAKADPKLLAVFGGLHSPPLITNNKFINNSKIPTMVSWAAGGPITRSKVDENWIFRLSIDDAQAGGFIAKYAVANGKCSSPYLLLEKTKWGQSNEKNMKKGLKAQGVSVKGVQLFGWGVSSSSSLEIAEIILKSKADCIFFVGNTKDAKVLFNAFGEKALSLPIYSHWGITGGDNSLMAKVVYKNKLDVSIIQTKFTFLKKNLSKYQTKN